MKWRKVTCLSSHNVWLIQYESWRIHVVLIALKWLNFAELNSLKRVDITWWRAFIKALWKLPTQIIPKQAIKIKLLFTRLLICNKLVEFAGNRLFLIPIRGVLYYKTKDKWKRFIMWMDIHENSEIKHSISLRNSGQVFANSHMKHLNSSETLS